VNTLPKQSIACLFSLRKLRKQVEGVPRPCGWFQEQEVQLWKGSVAGILQFLQHRGSHHGGCHLRIVWMYFHTGPSRLCFGECPISVHISVQCLFEDVRWICAAVGSRESSHKDVYDSRKWCNLVLKRASHDVPNSVCTKVHR